MHLPWSGSCTGVEGRSRTALDSTLQHPSQRVPYNLIPLLSFKGSMMHREELYISEYETIDWNRARNECAKEDLYYPHPLIQDALWWTLYKAEAVLQVRHLPGRTSLLKQSQPWHSTCEQGC